MQAHSIYYDTYDIVYKCKHIHMQYIIMIFCTQSKILLYRFAYTSLGFFSTGLKDVVFFYSNTEKEVNLNVILWLFTPFSHAPRKTTTTQKIYDKTMVL